MRKARFGAIMAAVISLGMASPAMAGEVYTGVYVQGVDTPFTLDVADQDGAAIQLGYRFSPVEGAWDIEPYVIASANTAGDSSFVGVGISKKFDLGSVYLRPGIGLVIQDQNGARFDPITADRTDLGSQVLFEPELAIGTQLSERVSIEASWVHLSHATLFDSEQNPGVDLMGVRLNVKL